MIQKNQNISSHTEESSAINKSCTLWRVWLHSLENSASNKSLWREFSYKETTLKEFIYTNKLTYRDQLQTSNPVEISATDKSLYNLYNVQLHTSHSVENFATNKSQCREFSNQKTTCKEFSYTNKLLCRENS